MILVQQAFHIHAAFASKDGKKLVLSLQVTQVHKAYQGLQELLDPKASVEILVILDPRVNLPFLNIFPFKNFM